MGDPSLLTDKSTLDPVRAARFARLWEQHRPRIWRLAARLAGDSNLADDLTQEVSVRAFQAWGSFRGEASPFTWLYRITLNVVYRHRERRVVDATPLDAPEVEALCTERDAGPETRALQSELQPMVWSALDRLPEELRTTVILQVFEGLKYREVAEVLNVPIGTVKSRLHNAMKLLREELKDYITG